MSKINGYEIEISFSKTEHMDWDILLIKGEKSHFMTFNVARTLSSVEQDVYSKIEQLMEEERK